MVYVWHAAGILMLVNAISGVLARDAISESGRKMLPFSLLVSAAYLVSLFFIL